MQTFTESINTAPVSKPKINWRYQFQQYGAVLAAAIPLYTILSIYLFYRRGYYDLYIANKIFAGVAAILLGITLLIGPLSRFFSFPDRWVQYRKELGIIGFFLAFIHGVVSLFFLPSKFPLSKFLVLINWPFVYGLLALLILISIFSISNNRASRALGNLWWKWQSWGIRLSFILVVLHVFVMKWSGWVQWYVKGGGKELVHPEWPGAGLLVGWFMAFVIFLRVFDFAGEKIWRAAWHFSLFALPAIYIATFWWGIQFLG